MNTERVLVVGAGIVGLAHAWSAAERGHQVTVIERTKLASGASIRNFGMVWPMGQTDEHRPIALKSRERWLKLAESSGIWASACGSIHVAHRLDEWNVFNEFYEASGDELRASLQLLSPDDCLAKSPAIAPNGLLGGLYSNMELCVNPLAAIRSLPKWLNQVYGVAFHFETAASHCSNSQLHTASGEILPFDRAIVCSGHDFETLFPQVFEDSPIRPCKLQMFRTVPQNNGWRLGPHLASGLTLRHYSSFRHCQSLQELAERVAHETPELDRYGIHVLASQDDLGRVVLGDSHQYGNDIEPFDSEEIDQLILRELKKVYRLPSWELQSHWNGVYAKTTQGIAFQSMPEPNIHICTGLGGSGMTLSFGLAESNWDQWSKVQQ